MTPQEHFYLEIENRTVHIRRVFSRSIPSSVLSVVGCRIVGYRFYLRWRLFRFLLPRYRCWATLSSRKLCFSFWANFTEVQWRRTNPSPMTPSRFAKHSWLEVSSSMDWSDMPRGGRPLHKRALNLTWESVDCAQTGILELITRWSGKCRLLIFHRLVSNEFELPWWFPLPSIHRITAGYSVGDGRWMVRSGMLTNPVEEGAVGSS